MAKTTPVYPSLTPKPVTTATGTSGYNIAPSPHAGVSAYGMVPGSTSMPSPFNDLASLYPNLSGANSQVSSNIMSQLKGELSPEVVNSIQDRAASFGVSSGMPGSGLARNFGARNLGLEANKLQGEGLQNYLATITGLKNTQTVSPETQIGLSQSNAQLESAPDPMLAAKEQERILNEYLNKIKAAQNPTQAPNVYSTYVGDQLVNRYDPKTGFTKGAGAARYYS